MKPSRSDEIRLAFLPLSRLPAGRIEGEAPAMASSSRAWPIAGVAISMIMALVAGGAATIGLPPEMAALFALAAGALATGAGDGACFEGYWFHAKGATARIRDHAPTDTTLYGIADRLQGIQRRNFYQLAAEASHRGRYYLEYTMSVDVTRDSPTCQPPLMTPRKS